MKKKVTLICLLLGLIGTMIFADGVIPIVNEDEYMHQAMVSHWKATDSDMISYITIYTEDKSLIQDEFAINDLCKKTLEEWKAKCAKINYDTQVFSFTTRVAISDYDFETNSFSIEDRVFGYTNIVNLHGDDGSMSAKIVNPIDKYSFKVSENTARSLSKKIAELKRVVPMIFYFKIIGPTSKKYKKTISPMVLNIELVSIDLLDPSDSSKVLKSLKIK